MSSDFRHPTLFRLRLDFEVKKVGPTHFFDLGVVIGLGMPLEVEG